MHNFPANHDPARGDVAPSGSFPTPPIRARARSSFVRAVGQFKKFSPDKKFYAMDQTDLCVSLFRNLIDENTRLKLHVQGNPLPQPKNFLALESLLEQSMTTKTAMDKIMAELGKHFLRPTKKNFFSGKIQHQHAEFEERALGKSRFLRTKKLFFQAGLTRCAIS